LKRYHYETLSLLLPMRNRHDGIDDIHQSVPAHIEYWRSCGLPDHAGGPFADRSGGLITFGAPNLEDAQHIVSRDPFLMGDLIEQKCIKEWLIE
jgi:uncharacterized protein YciI